MNRITASLVALTVSAALATSVCAGLAAPASAQEAAGPVVAITADDALVVASSPTVTAVASLPRGIVVSNHGGKPVTLTSTGKPALTKPRPGNAPATFTGLEAGRTYTVSVGGRIVGNVLAVSEPSAAGTLVVRATASPTIVEMAWQASPTAQTGPLTFEVTATAEGHPPVKVIVKDATAARVTGLDPHVLYTFSVVARNSAGAAAPVTATMARTLAEVTGRDTDTVVTTTKSATPAAPPQPAPAPMPAPAPAGPSTVTIWVCPDGFSETDGTCTSTLTYTYHDETQTAPYTYHSQFVETSRSWRDYGTDWSGTTCPYGGTLHDGHCVGWDVQGYTVQAKDSPPAGWLDDGSSYVKITRIKDPAPNGYLDDGTQWIRTAAKVSRTVPV